MQQHRRVEYFAEFGGHGHVVVVAVGAHDRHHVATVDGFHNRGRGVGGIKDPHVGVVAHQPDVVVDFPTAAVEFEGAVGDDAFDVGHHSITTERSTLPSCILWNASSTSPRPIRSETNFSSGNRPCRYRSIKVGKSRSGRQSPYHDDFSAPPCEKKSSSGMSRRMSGVGTPT